MVVASPSRTPPTLPRSYQDVQQQQFEHLTHRPAMCRTLPSRHPLVRASDAQPDLPPPGVTQMAGATAPLGFWDPLGLSEGLDEGRALFYREAELKHGRVAMLASVGFIIAESFHPLFGGRIDVPSYIAFQATPLQQFWKAVLLAVSFLEISSILSFDEPLKLTNVWSLVTGEGRPQLKAAPFSIRSGRLPGDLGFDPLGLRPSSPEEVELMQNRELNHGRAAMVGIVGMVAQELVTHEKLLSF